MADMNAGTAKVYIKSDLSHLQKGLGNAKGMLTSFVKTGTAILAGLKLLEVAGTSLKETFILNPMKMEKNLTTMRNLLKSNTEEMIKFAKVAKEASGNFTQSQNIRTMTQLSQNAVGKQDLPAMLNVVNKASKVLGVPTDVVQQTIADTFGAFKIASEDYEKNMDMVIHAVEKAGISFDEISASLSAVRKYGQNGLGLTNVLADIITLGQQGIKGGEAGSVMESIIRNAMSRESASLREKGLTTTNFKGEYLSAGEIVKSLGGYLKSLSEEERAKVSASAFGRTALGGASALAGGNNLRGLVTSAGTTEERFTAQMNTLQEQFNSLVKTVADFGTELYESHLKGFFATILEWLAKLAPILMSTAKLIASNLPAITAALVYRKSSIDASHGNQQSIIGAMDKEVSYLQKVITTASDEKRKSVEWLEKNSTDPMFLKDEKKHIPGIAQDNIKIANQEINKAVEARDKVISRRTATVDSLNVTRGAIVNTSAIAGGIIFQEVNKAFHELAETVLKVNNGWVTFFSLLTSGFASAVTQSGVQFVLTKFAVAFAPAISSVASFGRSLLQAETYIKMFQSSISGVQTAWSSLGTPAGQLVTNFGLLGLVIGTVVTGFYALYKATKLGMSKQYSPEEMKAMRAEWTATRQKAVGKQLSDELEDLKITGDKNLYGGTVRGGNGVYNKSAYIESMQAEANALIAKYTEWFEKGSIDTNSFETAKQLVDVALQEAINGIKDVVQPLSEMGKKATEYANVWSSLTNVTSDAQSISKLKEAIAYVEQAVADDIIEAGKYFDFEKVASSKNALELLMEKTNSTAMSDELVAFNKAEEDRVRLEKELKEMTDDSLVNAKAMWQESARLVDEIQTKLNRATSDAEVKSLTAQLKEATGANSYNKTRVEEMKRVMEDATESITQTSNNSVGSWSGRVLADAIAGNSNTLEDTTKDIYKLLKQNLGKNPLIIG